VVIFPISIVYRYSPIETPHSQNIGFISIDSLPKIALQVYLTSGIFAQNWDKITCQDKPYFLMGNICEIYTKQRTKN